MPNRLAQATSPYLQQHQDNPVDWYEWGAEAFTAARERDVPILLSVGYAACHWCHVMAHESFEDAETAAYLNDHFVAVKVDREERPDIDSIYMEATQAMSGHGGWPMTCVLTADGEPFFAGTYFPPEPRLGMPSFRQVLEAITTTWRERRDEVATVGAQVASHLRRSGHLPTGDIQPVGGKAVAELERNFDRRYGGFGGAPKFPPSMVLEFLLRRAARVEDATALQMADRTLEAMALGGMYDQLAGGFARYSVDERWDVPHFEKMLYDNALLLRVYLHWSRQPANRGLAKRIAGRTADFLLRELRTEQGGFASALDADSEGAEGTFYVWTPDQLTATLGPDDGAFAAAVFEVSAAGNFEGGTSTLRLARELAADEPERYAAVVARLLEERGKRIRPARDDKVVASWNGLVISALAETGVVLDDPRYLAAATAAAQLLADVHLRADGSLFRVSRDGHAGAPTGVLDDYACVADGFLTLYAATGNGVWFERAQLLVGQILSRFDDGAGGFFDTAVDAEVLLKRPQDASDNAYPSGQSMTAAVLTTMYGLTGDDAYRRRRDALLERLAGLATAAPRFAGQTLATIEAVLDGPRQVAVVGPENDPTRHDLVRAAFCLSAPGAVIAQGDGLDATSPLLADRDLVGGRPAAYPCSHFVCELPVTSPARLR
jgi:uncharacterized protein YyaL (SSP411 family)